MGTQKLEPIKVFIYNDDGVMEQSETVWTQAFFKIGRNFILSFITADMILKDNLKPENCHLFIMPGGRATPFHEKLGDIGKDKIKDFAKNGGKCLGVGAGAYFLSYKSEFWSHDGTYITRKGLDLIRTEARGPFSPINEEIFEGEGSLFDITYHQELHQKFNSLRLSAFCNGGCFFRHHTAAVIAATRSGEAVIIKHSDHIILSGVHPEFSSNWVSKADARQLNLLTEDSKTLLQCILKSLLLI